MKNPKQPPIAPDGIFAVQKKEAEEALKTCHGFILFYTNGPFPKGDGEVHRVVGTQLLGKYGVRGMISEVAELVESMEASTVGGPDSDSDDGDDD